MRALSHASSQISHRAVRSQATVSRPCAAPRAVTRAAGSKAVCAVRVVGREGGAGVVDRPLVAPPGRESEFDLE